MCLSLLFACGGGAARRSAKSADAAAATTIIRPEEVPYIIKNTYPHSRTSYTQGLFWYDGSLWESTGEYGHSRLMRVRLEDGSAERSLSLPASDFGEGAVALDSLIYMLTWQEERAYAYDAATLKLLKTFDYRGEGWGLTTDGEWLYMSDGTDKIYRIDPETFERRGTIAVTFDGRALSMLNELEWIDGRIWANVYLTNQIVMIDPGNGMVTGYVDLTGLLSDSDIDSSTDVLNGIAYDAEDGRLFVTGKNWPKLFEIETGK